MMRTFVYLQLKITFSLVTQKVFVLITLIF